MTALPPPGVDVRTAADFLGVDDTTIRRYVKNGTLKGKRIGPRLIRIDRDSLLKLAGVR